MIYGTASDKISFICVETRAGGVELMRPICVHIVERRTEP